jgi:hypothetical protein
MPSGTAVSASPKLWIRSASRATEPERTKIATWMPAVAASSARLNETVLTPERERRIERSTNPWL